MPVRVSVVCSIGWSVRQLPPSIVFRNRKCRWRHDSIERSRQFAAIVTAGKLNIIHWIVKNFQRNPRAKRAAGARKITTWFFSLLLWFLVSLSVHVDRGTRWRIECRNSRRMMRRSSIRPTPCRTLISESITTTSCCRPQDKHSNNESCILIK